MSRLVSFSGTRDTDAMETPPNESGAHRIVNRYMSNASAEEREQALDSLTRLARILMRIEDRLARQWHEQQIRDSDATAVESELQTPPS